MTSVTKVFDAGNLPVWDQISGQQTSADDFCVITAAEVERQLGLCKHTLIRMRKLPDCGGLPYVRLSVSRVGYLRADVRAYLQARRVGAMPETSAKAA